MPDTFPVQNGMHTNMARKPPRLLNVRRENKGERFKSIKNVGEGEDEVYPLIS